MGRRRPAPPANPSHRKCIICHAAYCRVGRASCVACAKTLADIAAVDRGRRRPDSPPPGHEERIARYAARAEQAAPLFRAAEQALRADPCE